MEVDHLSVVIRECETVEKFLAAVQPQLRQPLERERLLLDQVLVESALQAGEAVVELVQLTEMASPYAVRSGVKCWRAIAIIPHRLMGMLGSAIWLSMTSPIRFASDLI